MWVFHSPRLFVTFIRCDVPDSDGTSPNMWSSYYSKKMTVFYLCACVDRSHTGHTMGFYYIQIYLKS